MGGAPIDAAPVPRDPLVGREHGRTIPLAECTRAARRKGQTQRLRLRKSPKRRDQANTRLRAPRLPSQLGQGIGVHSRDAAAEALTRWAAGDVIPETNNSASTTTRNVASFSLP